jgi:hypothetical protein
MRRRLGMLLMAVLTIVGLQVAVPQTATAAPPSREMVIYWNNVLLDAFRRQGGNPTPLARAAAMMHTAIFDTINSAWWSRRGWTGIGYSSYLTNRGDIDTSVDDNLAVGFAARDLLIDALPAQRTFIEQKFTERHGTASQAVARSLADTVVANMRRARANDGSGDTTGYTPDGVPGAWRPTGTPACTPGTPNWGRVRPFALTSGSQFRRPFPGGFTTYSALLGSSLYANQLAEVRSLGRSNSTTRTATQTTIAWFWANDLDGTYKPPGQLLDHTRIASTSQTDPIRVARTFALVSLAMADAGIGAWDAKYLTSIDLWRPETAVQRHATNPDTTWRPLSADRNGVNFSPCFPAWVSGHATFAAAWAGIMRRELGDNVTFTATTNDPHAVGVTRTFTSFSQAATENARSRIYLGVHYQFDADDGLATGYNIANFVFDRRLTTVNCSTPCG